jgi:hypothetical protein
MFRFTLNFYNIQSYIIEMATTVQQLFDKFEIQKINKISWGTAFSENEQGIYIVSTSTNPDKHLSLTNQPEFDDGQIKLWLDKLPNFLVDQVKANPTILKSRLAQFWLPDESILYIGKAPKRKNGSGISKRVMEYFSTIIGDGGPHSGGQWIKPLKALNTYYVYYGTCDNPAVVELQMLEYFMSNVSKLTLSNLFDKELPIPFANIKFQGNKNHGLKNQRL